MSAPPIVSARPAPTPIVRPTPAKSAARKQRRDATPHHAADRFSNALEPQLIPASCALRRVVESSGRPSRRRLTCTSKAKIKARQSRQTSTHSASRSLAESSQTTNHHRQRNPQRAMRPAPTRQHGVHFFTERRKDETLRRRKRLHETKIQWLRRRSSLAA